MKLILIGMIVAVAIAAISFFGGMKFKNDMVIADDIKEHVHLEHAEIINQIQNVDRKLQNMDGKLEKILEIMTGPSAAELDMTTSYRLRN